MTVVSLVSTCVAIAFLLVLSAFFSASETAAFALGRLRLDYLTRRGNLRAATLQRMLREPDEFLTTILVGNNIVNTVAAVLGTSVAIFLFKEHAVLISAVVMTLLVLIVGEIFPKVLATQFSERIAMATARPFVMMRVILMPAAKVFTYLIDLVFWLFGIRVVPRQAKVTREELRHAVHVSAESGFLKGGEAGMLHRVFEFNDRLTKEVMIPKDKMVMLDKKMSFDEMLAVVTEQGYTRLPVYEESPDNVVGMIHSKDILNLLVYREVFILEDLIRKPDFVAATQPISEVLLTFQKERRHIAVVLGDGSLPVGLITMEDILEEIVGEIGDEHDA
ncbi:MAG: hemolysin family protein [Planctomycetota bacterium]|nr:hemolysin family protein [Planctomycetota bacterium]